MALQALDWDPQASAVCPTCGGALAIGEGDGGYIAVRCRDCGSTLQVSLETRDSIVNNTYRILRIYSPVSDTEMDEISEGPDGTECRRRIPKPPEEPPPNADAQASVNAGVCFRCGAALRLIEPDPERVKGVQAYWKARGRDEVKVRAGETWFCAACLTVCHRYSPWGPWRERTPLVPSGGSYQEIRMDPARCDVLVAEWHAELAPAHPLFGQQVQPVAECTECGSAWFLLPGGSHAFGKLSWSGHPEVPPAPAMNVVSDPWDGFCRGRLHTHRQMQRPGWQLRTSWTT